MGACGPFTSQDSLSYEPLKDLLEVCGVESLVIVRGAMHTSLHKRFRISMEGREIEKVRERKKDERGEHWLKLQFLRDRAHVINNDR